VIFKRKFVEDKSNQTGIYDLTIIPFMGVFSV